MKILIADDDPQILRALRITLTAHGYDIFTAQDGQAALTAAIEHHPDLVMLDLGMPRMAGLAVIDALRGWNHVPILVVSGRTGASDKVVTKQTLQTGIWGPHRTTDTGYLRLYMAQLRKKLESDASQPRYLLTEAGMGYRFNPEPGDH